MAELSDQEWRAAVLAGSDPDTRDTPALRANAAHDYFLRELDAADAASAGAETAVSKATAHLEAARDALVEAKAAKTAAQLNVDKAAQLTKDIVGTGHNVLVSAGVAHATGEARS